jgi:hypothetical protein
MNYDPQKAIRQAMMIARRPAADGGMMQGDLYQNIAASLMAQQPQQPMQPGGGNLYQNIGATLAQPGRAFQPSDFPEPTPLARPAFDTAKDPSRIVNAEMQRQAEAQAQAPAAEPTGDVMQADPGGSGAARGGKIEDGDRMDPRNLPGIHLKTDHRFAAGGATPNTDEDVGFDAYHGSPHEFDQFDIAKIGTGEGAQAYGHGLYFAENEDVAKGYRDAYANRGIVINGKPFNSFLNPETTTKEWESSSTHLPEEIRKHVSEKINSGLGGNAILNDLTTDFFGEYHEPVKKIIQGPGEGHMYHVRVKANPEHFLDWDAPLSEQSDHVKNLLGVNEMLNHDANIDKKIKELVSSVRAKGNKPSDEDKAALKELEGQKHKPHLIPGQNFAPKNIDDAKKLADAGIPGVKYFDAGSRGKGDGTRNYVVFDHNLIETKRRYNTGGAIDYRGEHTAPGPDSGKPMHNLTDVYPDDFYSSKGFKYYADYGEPYDLSSWQKTVAAKGNPEHSVSIYRAIPKDAYDQAMKAENPIGEMIKPGDWVTISKEYARDHGENVLNGKYKIAARKVKAKDIYTNGDSIHEWGWHPQRNVEERADGGEIAPPPRDFKADPMVQKALRLTAKNRPMVALADLFQRQLRGRPPS